MAVFSANFSSQQNDTRDLVSVAALQHDNSDTPRQGNLHPMLSAVET